MQKMFINLISDFLFGKIRGSDWLNPQFSEIQKNKVLDSEKHMLQQPKNDS